MDFEQSTHLLDAAEHSCWDVILKALEEAIRRKSQKRQDASTSIVPDAQLFGTQDRITGNTVGHFAALENRVDVLELLHRLGVDLRKSNFALRSPLEEARRNGVEKSAQFILRTVYTPVEALFYGDGSYEAMVDQFTAHPEAINDALECYNKMSWSSLCVEEGRLKDLRWLHAHGADFGVLDEGGNTLLHLIPISYVQDDSENRSIGDETSQDETASALYIEDPNARPCGTALSDAITEQPPETVLADEELLNASSGLPGESKHLIRHLITNRNLSPREQQILSAVEQNEEWRSSELESFEILAFLLSLNVAGLEVNRRNATGSTPAHLLAEKSSHNPQLAWRLLQMLQREGANLSLKDNDGANAAFILAANCGDGPWLTWALTPVEQGGGGCDADQCDVRGRQIEDLIVNANVETFDSELDVEEPTDEKETSSSAVSVCNSAATPPPSVYSN